MSGITDADIVAFGAGPAAAAATTTAARPRRWWPWLLGAALVLLVLLPLAGGAWVLGSLSDAGREGWHVSVDGEEWHGGFWSAMLALLGLGGGLLAALLSVMLVVPLTLGLVALGLGLGLGAVLLALGLVAAVVLSPLWLVVLVLWLALRKPRAAKVAP